MSAECFEPLPASARHGLELFNSQRYFDAHEALELAWRAEPGPIRNLYQGILQIGVGCYHIQRSNYSGALKSLQRGLKRLDDFPAQCQGVDLDLLKHDALRVLQELTRLGPDHISQLDQGLFPIIHFDEETR